MSFFGEIKRRKVFQVAAVYLVVSWLIMQVVDVVNEPLSLPDWFDTAVIVALAIGLPIALVLAWAFDLTPEGAVRDQGPNMSAQSSGRRIESVLFVLLIVSMVWVIYRVEFDAKEESVNSSITASPDADTGPAELTVMPNSIAVLVCDNLSPDPDNAFFAQSLHEEMLNQLFKVKTLSVISRTSVLPYVGAGRPIGEIARELNVESIMECSVAYADGRVAISAQLIDPDTGVNIWSERYNREFSDVFGIQLDIAVNIAKALQAEFSQDERASIEKRPTKSLEAYALYLQSLSVFPDQAQVFLDQAIVLDPEFALAYAARAHNYAQDYLGINGNSPVDSVKYERIVRQDAERALTLDPTLGRAHAALAAIDYGNWRATAAEEAFARAFELSPDPDLISEYGRFKRYRGEYDEAIRLQRRAHELDPNNWGIHYHLGLSYSWGGYYKEAYILFRGLSEADPGNDAVHLQLGRIAVFMGNRQEALQELHLAESLWKGIELNAFRVGQLVMTYSQAGSREDALRLFDALHAIADHGQVGDGIWAVAYLAMGDRDQALKHLAAAIDERVSTDLPTLSELAINPWNDPVLAEPAFRALLSGLWDYE